MRTGGQHHQRLEAEALSTTPSYKWVSTLFAQIPAGPRDGHRGQEEQQGHPAALCGRPQSTVRGHSAAYEEYTKGKRSFKKLFHHSDGKTPGLVIYPSISL